MESLALKTRTLFLYLFPDDVETAKRLKHNREELEVFLKEKKYIPHSNKILYYEMKGRYVKAVVRW